ncbi:MAG: PilZ domain-containing protein [Deltaproteobacteria bacterium]|nr:PilZ domain-containing protein [Deltaproteobacteria bacterium]
MDAGNRKGFAEKGRQEYRNCLRFPLSLQAKCHYKVGEPVERCRIVDISSEGLGLELDTPVKMQTGQLVFLDIDVATQKKPVSAITKLAWVRSQEDGFTTQRVGSYLLYVDPGGKEQLMEHAYAGLLLDISKSDMNSPG